MTRNELVEAVARRMCADKGMNPDQMIRTPAPPGHAGMVLKDGSCEVALWHMLEADVTTYLDLTSAVNAVLREALPEQPA
jgi:hypothetical protein